MVRAKRNITIICKRAGNDEIRIRHEQDLYTIFSLASDASNECFGLCISADINIYIGHLTNQRHDGRRKSTQVFSMPKIDGIDISKHGDTDVDEAISLVFYKSQVFERISIRVISINFVVAEELRIRFVDSIAFLLV